MLDCAASLHRTTKEFRETVKFSVSRTIFVALRHKHWKCFFYFLKFEFANKLLHILIAMYIGSIAGYFCLSCMQNLAVSGCFNTPLYICRNSSGTIPCKVDSGNPCACLLADGSGTIDLSPIFQGPLVTKA